MDEHYLSKQQLQAELDKCLNCKHKPCMHACPVKCSPQEFIAHAKKKDYLAAVSNINKNNPLGHVCGLVCPHSFCVKACMRAKIDNPINIPMIQATLIKMFRNSNDALQKFVANGKKIAIIGAGPAGMAAAWQFLKLGYQVKIFEKSSQIGGALNLIPDNRLPKEAIEDDWNYISQMGKVDIKYNAKINSPQKLLAEYDGVIVAVGEQNVINLGIKGEENIIPYTQYLSCPQNFKEKQKIVIIGGGNVAADAAITAHNLGAKQITLLVRRQINHLRIDKKGLLDLIDKGINILPNTRLVEAKKAKDGINLQTCSTYVEDGKCLDLPNSIINRGNVDLVVKAIGSVADRPIEHDKIIYAGDCKIGGSTVVEAVASGLEAAKMMHEQLTNKQADIA